MTDREGRVNLPIAISGSQGSPKVEFDRSGWGRMVGERLESELMRGLGRALEDLLDRRDEEEN